VRSYSRLLWVAIAVWIAGAIPLGFAVYEFVAGLAAPVHRFDAPGSVTVRLDQGDERAILVQTAGSPLARESGRRARASDLRCEARANRGGIVRPHPIGSYVVRHNRNAFRARLAFTAPRGDRYRVTCRPAEPLPLGVSEQLHLGRLFLWSFVALGVCAGTIMLGVKIARRARRARIHGPEAPGAPIPP
jgi:hypothetical protein